MKVSQYVIQFLKKLDLTHYFGVSGANIEPLFFSLDEERTKDSGRDLQVIITKNEYSAVSMAHGVYLATGKMGVVLVTSGGGAFNILPSLAELRSSRIPCLCLVGQVPTDLEGKGAFQDSSGRTPSLFSKSHTLNSQDIFSPMSIHCEKLTHAAQVPQGLYSAVRLALKERGPVVILLPKDVQEQDIHFPPPQFLHSPFLTPGPFPTPLDQDKDFTEKLNKALGWIFPLKAPPLVILGPEATHPRVRALLPGWVKALSAKVAVTPDGKGAYDHLRPEFLGGVGVMGHSLVREFLLKEAGEVVLVVGTALPLLAQEGIGDILKTKKVIHLHLWDEFFPETLEKLGFVGPLGPLLEAFMNGFPPGPPPLLPESLPPHPHLLPLSAKSYQGMVEAIMASGLIEEEADIFVDAGNGGAAVIHHFPARGKGLFYVALGMGGMGHTFGAAIGAALVTGKRTYVFAGDGSFFMHGLEIHTAVEHDLPLTVFLFNNHSHAMCRTRENLYGRRDTLEHLFKPAYLARGLGHMFPELFAVEMEEHQMDLLPEVLEQLKNQNREQVRGVQVISLWASPDEMPPFAPFLKAASLKGLFLPKNKH